VRERERERERKKERKREREREREKEGKRERERERERRTRQTRQLKEPTQKQNKKYWGLQQGKIGFKELMENKLNKCPEKGID
jgi:hypothetical protein